MNHYWAAHCYDGMNKVFDGFENNDEDTAAARIQNLYNNKQLHVI